MNRPAFLIGFSYLTVLFLSAQLPTFLLPYVASGFVLLFLICCFIGKIREKKEILVYLIVGFLAVSINFVNYNFKISPITKLDGNDAVISAKIVDIPYKKGTKYNYILETEKINEQKVKPFKIKLTSSEPLEADICDTFVGKVHFYLPKNSEAFDSKQYYRSKSIYILAYAYNFEPYNVKTSSEEFNLKREILNLRQKMLSMPKRVFPEKLANVMNGFLLGEKHNFPEDVKDNFDIIGIYHLITTSGIHISILTNFLLEILKKLRLNRKISATAVSVAILFFMAVNCFTPSIMRAGIMAIICNLGIIFFKKSDFLNSLGVAILLIVFPNPDLALNISVWLSVLSMLGIILLREKISDFINSKLAPKNSENQILRYFVYSISVGVSVSAFTFPIVAWFFRKWSTLFLISNLIMIPISTILLAFLTLFQVSMFLSFPKIIIIPISLVCGVSTTLLIEISNILAQIPFAMISLDYGFVNLCLAFSLILIAVSLLFKNYKKNMRLSFLMAFALHLVGFASYIIFNFNLTKLSVIDSSDGPTIVITQGFKKSVILCAEEKFNFSSLNRHLLKYKEFGFDYLFLVKYPLSKQKVIENIISKYKPRFVLCENYEIQPENHETSLLKNKTFSKNWENTKIEKFKIDNHTFIFLEIYETKFLVLTDGGDSCKLPGKYKKCDFLILNKLPLNYDKIETENIIISANNQDCEILINKLLNTNAKLFSNNRNGNIYIDIDRNNKYLIKEFC